MKKSLIVSFFLFFALPVVVLAADKEEPGTGSGHISTLCELFTKGGQLPIDESISKLEMSTAETYQVIVSETQALQLYIDEFSQKYIENRLNEFKNQIANDTKEISSATYSKNDLDTLLSIHNHPLNFHLFRPIQGVDAKEDYYSYEGAIYQYLYSARFQTLPLKTRVVLAMFENASLSPDKLISARKFHIDKVKVIREKAIRYSRDKSKLEKLMTLKKEGVDLSFTELSDQYQKLRQQIVDLQDDYYENGKIPQIVLDKIKLAIKLKQKDYFDTLTIYKLQLRGVRESGDTQFWELGSLSLTGQLIEDESSDEEKVNQMVRFIIGHNFRHVMSKADYEKYQKLREEFSQVSLQLDALLD